LTRAETHNQRKACQYIESALKHLQNIG